MTDRQLALQEWHEKGSQRLAMKTKPIYTPDQPSYRYAGDLDFMLDPGSSRCVCLSCRDGFNSVAAFDKHQRLRTNGGTICLDPASLDMVRLPDRTNALGRVSRGGWWVTALSDRFEPWPTVKANLTS